MSHNIITHTEETTRKYKSGREKKSTSRLEISAGDVLFYYIFALLVAKFSSPEFNLPDPIGAARTTMLDYFSDRVTARAPTAAARKALGEGKEPTWTKDGKTWAWRKKL